MTTHRTAKRQRFMRAIQRANKATREAYDLMHLDATIARRQPEARALAKDTHRITELIRCDTDFPHFHGYAAEADKIARLCEDFLQQWRGQEQEQEQEQP